MNAASPLCGKLRTLKVEKVWGREKLPAPFSQPDGGMPQRKPIGEIWFDPPAELDQLLVKYLFTSEKLSIQVHPSDAHAPHGSCGKDECWLVLDALPGAQLAIGFKEPISADTMRAAALDGSIEDLLAWHEVKAGDFFYLPAGTVHGIGAGISLIEIQQNSDITYRLFDHGRPRDLHLDQAIAVASGHPHDPALRRSLGTEGDAQLVDGPSFRLDRTASEPSAELLARYLGETLIMPVSGSVRLGDIRIEAGECGWAGDLRQADFSQSAASLVTQPCGVRQNTNSAAFAAI